MKMKEKLFFENSDKTESSNLNQNKVLPMSKEFSINRQLFSDLHLGFNDEKTSDLIRSDVKPVSYQPQERLFCIKAATQNKKYNKKLASLLSVHSYTIPLLVSFNLHQHSNDELQLHPTVCAVFHCSHCHLQWEANKKLPLVCKRQTQLIYGRSTHISIDEAFMLIDVLHWTKKFSCAQLRNAFPLLRKRTSSIEKTLIIKSISKSKLLGNKVENYKSRKCCLPEKRLRFYLQHNWKNFILDINETRREKLEMAVEKAIKLKNYVLACFLRNKFTSIESDLTKTIDNLDGTTKVVGLKTRDGYFYPGFFVCPPRRNRIGVEENSTDTVESEELYDPEQHDLLSFVFSANGRFDKDGRFCFDAIASNMAPGKFPSLRKTIDAQSRRKSKSDAKAADQKERVQSFKYKFCILEGDELDLVRIFKSGICYVENRDQFLFSGVFNCENQFISSYCITNYGIFIPGCTNDKETFAPFSNYASYDLDLVNMQIKDQKKNTYKRNYFYDKSYVFPKFPSRSEVTHSSNWFCFKNCALIEKPSRITVPCNDMYGNENLNVYIGGEKGPDKRLYLYGHYDGKLFFSGGPPVTYRQVFTEMPDFDFYGISHQSFSKRFGIYFNDSPSHVDLSKLNHQSLPSYVCDGIETVLVPNVTVSLDEGMVGFFKTKENQNEKNPTQSEQDPTTSAPPVRLKLKPVVPSIRGKENIKSINFLDQALNMNPNQTSAEMEGFSAQQRKLYEILHQTKNKEMMSDASNLSSSENNDQELKPSSTSRKKRKNKTSIKKSKGKLSRTSSSIKSKSVDHDRSSSTSSELPADSAVAEIPQLSYVKKTSVHDTQNLVLPDVFVTSEEADASKETSNETELFGSVLTVGKLPTKSLVISERPPRVQKEKPPSKEEKVFISRVAGMQDRKTKSSTRLDLEKEKKSKQSSHQPDPPTVDDCLQTDKENVKLNETVQRLKRVGSFHGIKDPDDSDGSSYASSDESAKANHLVEVKQWLETRSIEKKAMTRSTFFPNLEDFSDLSFTDPNFSYFLMPMHVKQFNQKMKRGSLRLPSVSDESHRKTKANRSSSLERRSPGK